ncbi:hypothetical protein C8F01DRAFT_1057881 [Mycena amicta]|nr:hypothetical protein C8F01DRAFT_1057881 [Mycena amicta]
MFDNAPPDEVLSEILAPALKVDEGTFSNTTSKVSPFATYTESPSAYLLVNKAWLRVATPLLYNTVVLRSKAQAKALERALSENPVLGQFIKQLRVEGGYGAPMHRILKLSPNISHLYLTLVIPSGDSTDGLCKGLALISPTSFILYDTIHIPHQAKNKMARNLVTAIVDAIPGWQMLSTFHCPYMADADLSVRNDRWQSIAQPLVKAQKLHTLTSNSLVDAAFLYETFKACPLRSIVIKERLSQYDLRYDQLERVDPVLKAMLVYKTWRDVTPPPGTIAPEFEPSLNPFYKPMINASEEVQDRIWSRVLYFALYVPELGELPIRWDIPKTRVSVLTVSSRFQRLGIPHLCAHVYIHTKSSLDLFADLLSKNLPLKRNISTLIAHAYPIDVPRIVEHQATMQKILPGIDGLRRLSSIRGQLQYTVYYAAESPIAWNTFVSVDFGRLEECSIRIATERLVSPAVFSRLEELRVLRWRCETSFVIETTAIPVDALPKLEELIVREADSSFGTVLSHMKLPSLKRARFLQTINSEVLLEIHGSTLSTLEIPASALLALNTHIFDLCSNLTSLTVCWAYQRIQPGGGAFLLPPEGDVFNAGIPVISVAEIIFDTVFPLEQAALKDRWSQFLVNTFPHESLPNLKEIRTTTFKWPTTERDIAKSPWVTAAETLLSREITLKDAEGKSWRPRLKVVKGPTGAGSEGSHSNRPARSSTRRGRK